jgi:kynureninase
MGLNPMDETLSVEACRALDAADPLRSLRTQFQLPPGVVYLDGNSLGALPQAALASVQYTLQQEWGQGLIRSWNDAGWIHRAQAVGDAIAPLVGAGAGELTVADSTSVNLHKVLWAAIGLAQQRGSGGGPVRRVLLTEMDNFPTDRYIAQGVCEALGWVLREVGPAPDGVQRGGTGPHHQRAHPHDQRHSRSREPAQPHAAAAVGPLEGGAGLRLRGRVGPLRCGSSPDLLT